MSVLIRENAAEHVVMLRLNRPEARNALDMATRQALAATFQELADDASVRCVVLTGNDQAFAAGADIKAMMEASPMQMQLRRLDRLWAAIAQFPKPIVAAVNGFALGGGCELALHADIIVAGEGARFGQPEVKVGIMPGAGGTQRLVRLVGKSRAMRLLMTAEMITGREAYEWGLVSQVVSDSATLDTALALARKIAAMPPLAIEGIKEVVLAGMDVPLDAALRLERKAMYMLFDTQDQKEGMKAFTEKRTPRFEGK